MKKKLGVIGVQLYCHANGIDESSLLAEPYKVKNKSLGNSTTLPKDYYHKASIMLVLKELAAQVAIRLRKAHKVTTNVSLFVGYSIKERKAPISVSRKIDSTNQTKKLCDMVAELFLERYDEGGTKASVSYGQLVDEPYQMFSLFDNIEKIEKNSILTNTIDSIRAQFGFTKLLKASSLTEDSRIIKRSQQIGGHSAGGLDGLQ